MIDRASRGFASDNAATVHPAVLAAIARVNVGHAFGYGHDDYTASVEALFEHEFGEGTRTFFVFNGTGANVVAMRAACRPWQGVICAETAHVNVDECGAPEYVAGVKLLAEPAEYGKLTPEIVSRRIERIGDEHAVQPRMVTISQATELGTVYTAREIQALAELAHENGMVLHVDGARLANAAESLDVPLRALTRDAGVDILTFGGTKNGLLLGEAVVVLREDLAESLAFVRKQSMQLASKMRFIAAQFEALLTDELWLRCARQANTMASRLASRLSEVGGVKLTRPVEANAVFAIIPERAREQLQREFDFYVWDEATGEVRWMCAWDTTEEDVDTFAVAVADAVR